MKESGAEQVENLFCWCIHSFPQTPSKRNITTRYKLTSTSTTRIRGIVENYDGVPSQLKFKRAPLTPSQQYQRFHLCFFFILSFKRGCLNPYEMRRFVHKQSCRQIHKNSRTHSTSIVEPPSISATHSNNLTIILHILYFKRSRSKNTQKRRACTVRPQRILYYLLSAAGSYYPHHDKTNIKTKHEVILVS